MYYRRFVMSSVAALALLAPMAHAQEITELDPIYIEGEDSQTTSRVDAEDIRQSQAQNLNELFARTPEVNVSGGNRTAAQKTYVRGLEDTQLNVSVDGAKTGASLYAHSASFGINPQLLKKVDVQAGALSALVGPGALGGALRYETKDAEDLLLPGTKQGAMFSFSGETNGQSYGPSMAVYGTPDERFSYLAYISKTYGDDYEDGDGNTVESSASEPLDGLVKLKYRLSEDQEIAFSNLYHQDDGSRLQKVNLGVPSYIGMSTPFDQQLSFRQTSLRYSYSPADNPMVDFSATAYDTLSRLRFDIDNWQRSDYRTRGVDLRNRSDFGSFSLTYGYDYSYASTEGVGYDGARGKESADTHGLYLQADYTALRNWLFSAGARYDNAHLDGLDNTEYDGHRLSPNASVTYMPVEGMSVFAGYGEAFRGVQPVEGMTLISSLGQGASDTSLTGEVSRTAQAGVKYDANGWRAGLALFETRINGKIGFWNGSSAAWSRSDLGELETRGVTANIGRSFGNLSVDLGLSHTDVTLDGEPATPGDWLSGVIPGEDKAVLNVGYAIPQHDLTLAYTGTWVASQTDLPDGYALDKLPSYATHDISMTWTPRENQTYTLAVTNLFDKQYIDHSTPYFGVGGWSTLYEQGRSVRAQATIRF